LLKTTLISKILIIRTDRLGDFLMNVPVIHRLRENFPEAEITVVCHPQNRELAGIHAYVDRVIPISLENLNSIRKWVRFYRQLRSHRFDCVVLTQPHKYFHLLAYLLGIPLRIGFRRKWGFLLNVTQADQKGRSEKHEIDYNLALLDPICPQPWSKEIDFGWNAAVRQSEILNRFSLRKDQQRIVFHVTTSNDEKRWPLERFRAVIGKLLEDGRFQVVLVGGESSDEVKRVIHFDSPAGSFVDLAGKTSLLELAALLKQAHCVVSLDSGPYHLAWMQKVPVVGIFIKEAQGSNPRRWGVYPGFVRCRQIENSADEITGNEVLDAVLSCTEAAV